MPEHKYRISKIKREHHIIDGVFKILEKISEIPGVDSIIPGRIKQTKGVVSKPEVRFTVETSKGIKCIAQSQRAVQEIFIVATDYQKVLDIGFEKGLIKLESKRD